MSGKGKIYRPVSGRFKGYLAGIFKVMKHGCSEAGKSPGCLFWSGERASITKPNFLTPEAGSARWISVIYPCFLFMELINPPNYRIYAEKKLT
jgi:hypothetical protein